MGVAGCLWAAWCEFPVHAWNDLRLAPAFALRHGIDPYPPLGGGPLSTWIYGPVGIFVNLPATFASTAPAAMHSASLINAAVVIGPLALIFFASSELRARGLAIPLLALLLAILFIPRPNLVFHVADHSAIAFGLLSCWFLARRRIPTNTTLAVAGALCAAAVWSKQIAVFLLVAQVIYLLLGNGRSIAFRHLTWVAFFGFSALGCFIAAFGFNNLWLNLVEIPGRLPWADVGQRLMTRPASLVGQIALPAIGLWLIWHRGLWPSRALESGRFFLITTLAAAAMLPIGLAALLKVGGDTNVLHSWDYLLPAFLLLFFAKDQGPSFTLRLAVIVIVGLLLRRGELSRIYTRPLVEHYSSANALMAMQGGEIWFPQNPVITFYATKRLWHAEDGIATRYLANYGIREPDFRRHLPAEIQAVAYPQSVTNPFAIALLQDFDRTDRISHWIIYSRSTASIPHP